MHGAEIELKFPVADSGTLRAAALKAGFQLLTERTFERNTLYDTADRQLRERRQILRLRHYGDRWTVTHKRQTDGGEGETLHGTASEESSRYKTRIETESTVEDGEALAEIFAQLGYGPVFRYEKFRTEWESGEGHLVLDETPIGVWAELEGKPEWIDRMLERLGVSSAQCSTESYGKLFLQWKDATGSPAENLTFDEIQPVTAG
jgi:adenylate cyclase class 2